MRQLHLDWGRVGVAWGKAIISLSLPAPGAGAGMPADWRPQPWRETRSPALARCLSDGSRGGGGPGWLASCAARAKTHNGHLAAAQPPPQPKTRWSGSGSSGSAARPAPPRARCFLARPLSLARPIPLARAASSWTRGSRPAGRKAVAVVARRREVGGHCFTAPARKAGLRSKLSAAAGGPRRGGRWGPAERAESPARPSIVLLFLCSRLSAHCSR